MQIDKSITELKSDYFRIEIKLIRRYVSLFAQLKSDYFRIEITLKAEDI